ncbi:MAG: flagellar motor protein MotB [Alphaproteobacteria bacterium]
MARKKQHSEHHEEHADETWLVPYADILTLLLALFIVLFASSNLDKKKAGELEQAFTAAFNANPPEQLTGTILTFMDDLKTLDLGKNVSLGSDSRGALIEIANIDMFETGSARIKKEYEQTIIKISKLLNENRYKRFDVVVEGHTDSEEANGSQYPTKWDLSSIRAASIVNEFVTDYVEANRLKAVGMANIAPKYPNLDPYGDKIPENQKKNRRVVIRIEP